MPKADEELRLLSPKQRRVYEYLRQGRKPPTIAHAMKITRSAVYNHMRNIRRLGVTLPNEAPVVGATNGEVKADEDEVVAFIKDRIVNSDKTLANIDQRIEEAQETARRLAETREREATQRERYERMLAV